VNTLQEAIAIPASTGLLTGELSVPENAGGLVIFAHGTGSSHLSPRNQFVAQKLNSDGFATFLFDLLTEDEEIEDLSTGDLRFDIAFLADRLTFATSWLRANKNVAEFPYGFFGASTGAAAALRSAAGSEVRAIVSRGGRPDMAGDALTKTEAATLLIVGGEDKLVLELNRQAYDKIRAAKRLAIIPGATHLFEEPGTLEHAAQLAGEWFLKYLRGPGKGDPAAWKDENK
jgi:dienelactone hydrolase